MIKSALLATALCFAFVVPASAQLKSTCDEASLTKMRTQIDAMTDKEKQAKSIESWEAANTAFKSNNTDECNARMSDSEKNIGAIPPSTTTTQ